MNYTDLLDRLRQASLFDLYRLRVAIDHELENPRHVRELKQKLRLGMALSYFDRVENRSIKATLVGLRQKSALILDHERHIEFIVPYYMLNLDGIETAIHEKTNTLTANNLKVGDCVGFNNDGSDIVGIVQRLNHKTATVHTQTGQKWRVGYSHLYRIHDAEIIMEKLPQHFIGE